MYIYIEVNIFIKLCGLLILVQYIFGSGEYIWIGTIYIFGQVQKYMEFIENACLLFLVIKSILYGPEIPDFDFNWDIIGNHSRQISQKYNHADAQLLLQLSLMVSYNNSKGKVFTIPSWFEFVPLNYDVCPNKLISDGLRTSAYNVPGNLGYVFYSASANVIFIVFSGTANTCMSTMDIDYEQQEYSALSNYQPGVRGHGGMYQAYLVIRSLLLSTVNKYYKTGTKIMITGHSLGGGMSQICSFDLAGYQPIHYSFAAPLVFNPFGAIEYNKLIKNSYRVINSSDLVTHIPLPIMPNKDLFATVGTEIAFQWNLGVYFWNHTVAYMLEYGLVPAEYINKLN